MGSLTVRIREGAYQTLRDLAARTGKPLQEVLTEAIERYRRSLLLEQTNAAFAALKNRPEDWDEERRERQEWDATLGDSSGDEQSNGCGGKTEPG